MFVCLSSSRSLSVGCANAACISHARSFVHRRDLRFCFERSMSSRRGKGGESLILIFTHVTYLAVIHCEVLNPHKKPRRPSMRCQSSTRLYAWGEACLLLLLCIASRKLTIKSMEGRTRVRSLFVVSASYQTRSTGADSSFVGVDYLGSK